MKSQLTIRIIWSTVLLVVPMSTSGGQQTKNAPKDTVDAVIYVGLGNSKSDVGTPWSAGMLAFAKRSEWIFGLDVGGEGTKTDNRSGRYNGEKQAMSLNIAIGNGKRIKGHTHLGLSGLFGMRQTDESWGQSYLGYQCYADEAPRMQFTANFGVIANIAYKNAMVGTRITNASSQILFGLAF
jgi:hypothetical protein